MLPGEQMDSATCKRVSDLLARVGDKWTLLVVGSLGAGPLRFNALQRRIGDISQKMLAATLRNLERDGMINRHVLPVTPPQVEYTLTAFGCEFLRPASAFADWAAQNAHRIEHARETFDRQHQDVPPV